MRESPERSYMMVVDCVWVGEGGRGAEECVALCFSLFSSLCLQLEAHPDFVSAGVEVLPVDQG